MGRRKKPDEKIIHVKFGPGGGRVLECELQPIDPPPDQTNNSNREPLTDLFTRSEISRLLGLTPGRLRTLDKAGIVTPTGRRNGRRASTCSHLIALRTAQTRVDRRVRRRDVTRAIGAVKRSLPKGRRPLQGLRVVSDGQGALVRTHDGVVERLTGQMVMDLEVRPL